MEDFRERLKQLKDKRKQASHSNFRELLEENERSRRPANWEKKLERNLKRLEEEEAKQKAEEVGQDYELKKSLDYRADEIEKWEKFRGHKRRQDSGFVDFEEASKRQYTRHVKQLKPNLEEYSSLKVELGEERFYAKSASSSDQKSAPDEGVSKAALIKDCQKGVDRMVEDVHKQIEIRSKRSRRRRFDDDANVDYINERNMKFNKKLERFYGEHTDEIKKNFERGTAM